MRRGRDHLVMATDEVVPSFYNFNGCPRYVLALRTEEAKLGVYADWLPGTATVRPENGRAQVLRLRHRSGRLELDNTPDDPRAKRMLRRLLTQYVPHEMEQPLPGELGTVSRLAKEQFIAYVAALDRLTSGELTERNLGLFTAYGDPF